MQKEETIDCIICGTPTTMLETKQCDRCYEITSRMIQLLQSDPEAASNILSFCMEETVKLMS